ncbi:contractile injection system tape measure protein [Nocardioides conyzicola]|uniref:Uncharacterized protein n=1 Tax=Nocardioides conyzicola TaxID=1651781 RepID=A0ABP8Y0N5_9ACTN
MTDIAIDRLRLRGPQAARLAAVAARALPAALERALADLRDVELDGLRVVLEMDPAAYDDETLAVLWADLIRAEVLRIRAADGPGGPVAGSSGPRGSASLAGAERYAAGRSPLPTAERVATDARLWLSTAPDGASRVPVTLLSLADPALAQEVARLLRPTTWARLVDVLARVLPQVGWRSDVGHASTAEPSGTDEADPGAVGSPASADLVRRPSSDPTTSGDDSAPPAARVPDLLLALAELHSGERDDLDRAAVTRAAGLVLLYPWLADHCRLAESLHPGLDPVAVREAALAALLDDPSLVDDPLVRLLAGRDLLTVESADRSPLPRLDEVAASAERVLAAFAALLPGFRDSTPGFVRDGWLSRLGVLDLDRDPVLLTAATHPLDVLLPMLPYPLGLVKLPWSPLLSMRFRP